MRLLDKNNYPVVGQSAFVRLLDSYTCIEHPQGPMRCSATNADCYNSNNLRHCPSCYNGWCFPDDRWGDASTNGNGVAVIHLFAGGVCPSVYAASFGLRIPVSAPCATFTGCYAGVRQTSFDLANTAGQRIGDCVVGVADAVVFSSPTTCGVDCDFDGDGVATGLGDQILFTPHVADVHRCVWSAFKPGGPGGTDVKLSAEVSEDGILLGIAASVGSAERRFVLWRFRHDFSAFAMVAEVALTGEESMRGLSDREVDRGGSYLYLVQEILDAGELVDHGGTTVGPFYTSAEYRRGLEALPEFAPEPGVVRLSWGRLLSRY